MKVNKAMEGKWVCIGFAKGGERVRENLSKL